MLFEPMRQSRALNLALLHATGSVAFTDVTFGYRWTGSSGWGPIFSGKADAVAGG
jgi:hypothetical protein